MFEILLKYDPKNVYAPGAGGAVFATREAARKAVVDEVEANGGLFTDWYVAPTTRVPVE